MTVPPIGKVEMCLRHKSHESDSIHAQRIPDDIRQAVVVLQTTFQASGRFGYNPDDGSGFWKKVLIRTNRASHLMVAVYVIGMAQLAEDELFNLKNDLARVAIETGFTSMYLSDAKDSSASHLVGATHIIERIGGLKYAIGPETVYPVSIILSQYLKGKQLF